jgi:hypothetical protein
MSFPMDENENDPFPSPGEGGNPYEWIIIMINFNLV